jgi:hypothetical protein
MAAILFIGYLVIIILNLQKKTDYRIPVLYLLMIGIGVQFSWETVLLITGIRPFDAMPLIVNSLIETNLGLPYSYFIHGAIKRRIALR